MRLQLSTLVDNDFLSVKERFTEDLFLKLNPPFPPVKLNRFDGCAEGDRVELELNFLLFKQQWHSVIVDDYTSVTEFVFIDEGVKLPFMFTYWRHKHIVRQQGECAEVIDDIICSMPAWIPTFLMKPVLWLQFAYRKPIYRKMLSRKNTSLRYS